MSTFTRTTRPVLGFQLNTVIRSALDRIQLPRTSLFGLIMIAALIAFEVFNYGTTEFALTDLLGNLQFAGLRWSTILALAFCSMDFAGIARLFSPDQDNSRSGELWYLLGAWLLAATMNAMLTWWAVSLALLGHAGLGNEILGREALLGSVPVFVALLVWLIRVLMIGTFTLAGKRLIGQTSPRSTRSTASSRPAKRTATATRTKPRERVPHMDIREQPAHKPQPKPNGSYRQRPLAAKAPRSR
ncbi:MAG: hypothetical protein KAR65_01620 [Anaerolineales bacterium]|nr:hypothetical protein [Anaerolineales bacterium]MCK5633942.1 hypothetical protein [Anaerolineales bacterium]